VARGVGIEDAGAAGCCAAGANGAAGAAGAATGDADRCTGRDAYEFGPDGPEGIDGCGDDVGAKGDMRGGTAGAVGAAGGGAVGAGADATGAAAGADAEGADAEGADAAGADAAGAIGAGVGGVAGATSGATGARGGVSRAGAATGARSPGGVSADGREGMLVPAEVRGTLGAAGAAGAAVAPPCAAKLACIGCGGVGIETGGRGESGAAIDGRWRAGVCAGCGAGADAVKSSSMRPRSPIAITPPHTEQRARTPASGILAGSTRKTELHSGQVTFMRRRSSESCSVHRSDTPTGEPRIGSLRRSTT